MALPNRTARVADTIKRTLTVLLLRKVRDPRIKEVTVTDVEISSDLTSAKVYVHINNDAKLEILSALQSASGFFRSQLSETMKLRVTPSIKFKLDDSYDKSQRIESLLASAKLDTKCK